MTKPSPTSSILHEMAALRNYLTAAQDVVRSGHMPDLTGLESRIAALCESIVKAEPDIQGECLPQLHELLEALGACEKTMRTSQNSESETQ